MSSPPFSLLDKAVILADGAIVPLQLGQRFFVYLRMMTEKIVLLYPDQLFESIVARRPADIYLSPVSEYGFLPDMMMRMVFLRFPLLA